MSANIWDQPLIQVKNLQKSFGANTVLDGVTVDIYKGDVVCVIGASGSGKSTFLRCLNLLEEPTGGQILFEGTDITDKKTDINKHRQKMGMVFQQFNLFPHMTILENLTLAPMKLQGKKREETEAEAMKLLERVGLQDRAAAYPNQLSGGQKRRVAIAGVLAMEPRLLVLDEPAAGLDPEGRDMILGQIREYHKQTGSTIVLVSHSMEDIAKYADRVLVMNAGRIAMYDATDKVFARAPELLELGLSVPEVTKIFLRLREMGLDIDTDVYTVKYAVKTILAARAAAKEGM